MSGSTGKRAREQAGDEAVRRRTGRDWAGWLKWLDGRGARELDHQGIVALLKPAIDSPWWQQMVAVGYEQERGLRAVHERATGFEIGRTRTVDADPDRCYRLFRNSRSRARWLGDHPITFDSAVAGESLHGVWGDGHTTIEVQLEAKPGGRTQVSVAQRGLKSAAQAEKAKTFWSRALDRLKADLAGGS